MHLFGLFERRCGDVYIPRSLLELVNWWWPEANNECIYNVKSNNDS